MVEIAASLSKEDGLILGELGSVLVGLGIAAFIASRIKFSVVPIFLLAGLFFGNGGIVSLELSDEFLDLGAQWGAILLLLLLGLEYSAQELFESVKKRKSLGVVDLVVNFIPGAVIALILGWGLLGALTLGGISYVSSSGIASQFIKDSRLESQESTRRAVGVLVIVGSALIASGVATYFGFSGAVAAFLVGLLLTGDVAIVARVRLAPLRDLFSAIFFLFFGLSVDPADIPSVLVPAIALAVIGIATKWITAWWAVRDLNDPESVWRAAALLIPRGEFSMVIAGLAASSLFAVELQALTLTYVILTTLFASIVIRRIGTQTA